MRCVANYEVKTEISVISDLKKLAFVHPSGHYRAWIRNIVRKDFSSPFLLSVQVSFNAESLNAAREIADERLAEFLNMLAFTTGGSFQRHRIKQIVDATPTSGMRDCHIWADTIGHEDPQPFLSSQIMSSIEKLSGAESAPAVRRALRWYRIGINASVLEEQYQYFWFALEVLAEHRKATEKVHDACPVCRNPLYCFSCDDMPKHRPYAKQAIRALILATNDGCDEKTLAALDKARNAIMHGATLKEIEAELHHTREEIIDILGRILFNALVRQFPNELFDGSLLMGTPSTFVHRTLSGIAHVQTIVPPDKDGELDMTFKGMTVSMETDDPPNSAEVTVVPLTREQHSQFEELARKKDWEHHDLFKRLSRRVRMNRDQIEAGILEVDLGRINAAIAEGADEEWRVLLRNIFAKQTSNQ